MTKPDWTLPPLDAEELAHISEDLRPLAVPIDSVFVDPDNVRLHPERNARATQASLSKYGQRKPVVVNKRNMTIEAGNGTREAALALGWKWIAISREDDDSVTAAGYAIADNRTAELAAWDYQGLSMSLEALAQDGVAIEELGFNGDELAALSEQFTPPVTDPDSLGDYNEPTDTYQIRVDGVKPDERDQVLEAVAASIAAWEHLKAQAY